MANETILDDFDDHLYLSESDEQEVVAKFFSPLEAELAASRLRSEDIPCFLAGRTAQSVLPHLQSVMRLHVRPQDLEQAREVLGDLLADTELPKSSGPISWGNAILLILAMILGVQLALMLVKIR
jgi:hypothetical protein